MPPAPTPLPVSDAARSIGSKEPRRLEVSRTNDVRPAAAAGRRLVHLDDLVPAEGFEPLRGLPILLPSSPSYERPP